MSRMLLGRSVRSEERFSGRSITSRLPFVCEGDLELFGALLVGVGISVGAAMALVITLVLRNFEGVHTRNFVF
eukprot:164218-Prorocentrum_minimum.AAC.2